MKTSQFRSKLVFLSSQFFLTLNLFSYFGLASEAPQYRCWSSLGATIEVNPWQIRVTPAAGMPFDSKVTSVTSGLDAATGWTFTAERFGDSHESRLQVTITPNPNSENGTIPYVGSLTFENLPEPNTTELNCNRR